MKRLRRVLFYLLLNVLVSACTTALVLSLWGRFNPFPEATVEPLTLLIASPSEPTVPPETSTPQPTPTLILDVYQVQAGDTLGTIAEQFEVSVEDLIRLNGLTDPNALGSGETILIPLTPTPTAPPPTETGVPSFGDLLPSGQDLQLQIVTIVAAGVLGDERVDIRFDSEGRLSLANWRLADGDGNEYVFPELTLFKGGSVSVYSKAGTNTADALYWGLNEPVWQFEETAILRDPQGNILATYIVP
jgi:LysM repeat protein